MLKKICIITNKYPNKYDNNVLVFLKQLVHEFADLGINCDVICPMPINLNIKYIKLPYVENEYTLNGNVVRVYRPKYIGFGQTKIFGFNPARITTKLFEDIVLETIKKNAMKPDVFYSHFITPAGIAAATIGKKLDIPSFMAYGEATEMSINNFGGAKKVSDKLMFLKGVIAVSQNNKSMLMNNNIIDEKKIVVFPNGYNPKIFYSMERNEARKRFNFSQDEFIVGFVGSFDDRKGILRLQKAIDNLENVKFACAGKGPLQPDSNNCIFCEPVLHSELVQFYNACDVFCLPTQREGCCNAIIEAMACGVPIVSSNLEFNDDILDYTNSIRINPNNINEIIEAIDKLHNNPVLRESLKKGCLDKAKSLTIRSRAKNIINYINKLREDHEKD